MARLLSKNKNLNSPILHIDKHLQGTTKTYSSDSWVTDSASSATAYSCGIKTYNGAIGVDPKKIPRRTILESAKRQGYKVGLVVTSVMSHATPAAFSAHVEDRNMHDEIASQQITKNIDILFGGGRRHYLPRNLGGNRGDLRNLIEEARQKYGYQYIETRKELLDQNLNKRAPLLGLFEMGSFRYEIDRKYRVYEELLNDRSPQPPTLKEMTEVAIDVLQRACNNDGPSCPGFFLMVEASKIDFGAHENDPGVTIEESLDFDETFYYTEKVAERLKNTLIVSVADHATGSLTLGNNYAWFPNVLEKQKISTFSLLQLFRTTKISIREAYDKYMGINDLNENEIKKIQDSIVSGRYEVFGEPISKRAGINWANYQHDGVDVPHYSFGPSSDEFRGQLDNTDICKKIVKYLNLEGVGEPINLEKNSKVLITRDSDVQILDLERKYQIEHQEQAKRDKENRLKNLN